MVRQVDSVEVRVVSNQLCSGQDMLTERIIKIIVFIGDVQRMTGQVAQRDDFIAAFQQQFRDIESLPVHRQHRPEQDRYW